MNCRVVTASGDVIALLHNYYYYFYTRIRFMVAQARTSSGRGRAIGVTVGARDGELRYPLHYEYSYFNFLTCRFAIGHPATFVSRAVWQRIGRFDEALQYAMDMDLWLRIGS